MTQEHIIGMLYIKLLETQMELKVAAEKIEVLQKDVKNAHTIIQGYESKQGFTGQNVPETSLGSPNN